VSIRYSNNGSSRKMEKDQAHAAWDARPQAGWFAPLVASQKGQYRSRDCLWWDVSDLTSWSQVSVPLRWCVRTKPTPPI
jgi:hypothetical protein